MQDANERTYLTFTLKFEYLKGGAKSVKAISDKLALSDSRVRTLLSQLKKRGEVINLGRGIWGITSQRQEEL